MFKIVVNIAMSLLGKKIMLVDDEQDVLTSLKAVLEHEQASVEAFLKPQAALEAFTARPNEFDILITDVKMSVMNGFELAAEIQAIRPSLPIIYISAYEFQKSIALPAGITVASQDMLRKPFDMQNFCDAINKRLSRMTN